MRRSILKKIMNRVVGMIERTSFSIEERVLQHGGRVGKGVFWGKDVLVDYDYAFLLKIDDGAVISARTIIELHDSSLPNVLGEGKNRIGRVHIGERAYIGVNSVILPGVSIGAGAIVGACSLVNRSIPNEEVWAGVPVKRIGTVDELVLKREIPENSNIGYFDWIGEIEKLGIDYEVRRNRFLDEVKRYFAAIE
jgi:maltose O-acetyltransferase